MQQSNLKQHCQKLRQLLCLPGRAPNVASVQALHELDLGVCSALF